MLDLYGKQEKSFATDMLQPIYVSAVEKVQVKKDIREKSRSIINDVYHYDYDIHNSSAQARRNARGYFLERILQSLLNHYAKDQFMSQVKMVHDEHEKRIDFVVGVFEKFVPSDDLLYVTVKKSLRERGPQVSDEKIFLGTKILFFFYADIKKLSDGIMTKFYNEDIVLVTYADSAKRNYEGQKNVVSYDKFFLEMLPGYLKDRKSFNILDYGIETYHKEAQRSLNLP
jgi:hypothetical protein